MCRQTLPFNFPVSEFYLQEPPPSRHSSAGIEAESEAAVNYGKMVDSLLKLGEIDLRDSVPECISGALTKKKRQMKIDHATDAPAKRESTKSHWEDFWTAKKEVTEVYSNDNRVLRNLLEVTDLRGKKVMEIGAGTGRDSFGMVEKGASVFMVDYATSSLQIIRNIAIEEKIEVNTVGGNAFSLPFPDGAFDVVFHQGLLEHFRENDASNLLKENIRVLKKGGYLLVDVPQRYHVYTVMKHILIYMDKWFAGWEREFSIPELDKVLRSQGVKPVYKYGEWMYPSLFYRVMREGLRKFGIRLPLNPTPLKPLTSLRKKVRESLRRTPLAIYTSLSCGIISRKPE